MRDHKCAKIVRKHSPAYLNGYMEEVHGDRKCWVCDVSAATKYASFMPYLQELHAWLEDGEPMSYELESELHYYFSEYLGSDTLVDEWLCDRPGYIEDLIGKVEHHCIRETA